MTLYQREHGEKWLTYTKPFDKEIAIERFKERFGYEPEKVDITDKYMFVGPVKEEE
jgi:hypothetical protein